MLRFPDYINKVRATASFLIIITVVIACYGKASAQVTGTSNVRLYIESLKKPDGGYGWYDQYDSHITPTYAVVGIMNDLGMIPEDKIKLSNFIKANHPQRGPNREAGPSGTDIRSLLYHQIQSISWLGQDVSSFRNEVQGWSSQQGKLANYESNGLPVLIQEMVKPVCYPLLGLPVDSIRSGVSEYLAKRERINGSYNNAPTASGGDGNIINTYWSLVALKSVGNKVTKSRQTAEWINACQLKNGGFTHQPNAVIGKTDDIIYLWSAVKSLELLGMQPSNREGCIKYLSSLRNEDGGFANRPGLPSTPMSTFYAINALKALKALDLLETAIVKRNAKVKSQDFTGYKVYSVQFQASGSGSISEAVMLADTLKIHLWGAKNAGAGWIEAAQQTADARKVPVTFFQCDEPYGKDVTVQGMGRFGHILDYLAPAGAPLPFKTSTSTESFRKSAITLDTNADWTRLKPQLIDPILQAGGSLLLQVANNEPMARILLDESLISGGYGAISTIHFGQNFSFWLPYLHEYRHLIPMVSLQDAHGTESWWWAGELAAYRTLFLAKAPTYAGLKEALKNNRVVAVRHDSISEFRTRMLGGTDDTRKFIINNEPEWRWWNDSSNEAQYPWGVITVIHPADSFEVAAPKSGVNIRIRVRWMGVRNNIRKPLLKLINLKVNGKAVGAEDIIYKAEPGKDSYYLYQLKGVAPGKYTVEATLQNLVDNKEKKVKSILNIPDQP